MFNDAHYVPVLKLKEGELLALRELAPSVRSRLTPLLELPPVPWDYDVGAESKTLDEYTRPLAEKVSRSWPPGMSFFLDMPYLESEFLQSGDHALTVVAGACRSRGLRMVPVVGLGCMPGYLSAVRACHNIDRFGVAVRLDDKDFEEFTELPDMLGEALEQLDVRFEEVDVVLDMNEMPSGQVNALVLATTAIVNALPQPERWRSITLVGSGFPENLSAYLPGSVNAIPRTEWLVWKALLKRHQGIARVPSFGDYAVAHPEPAEIDPRVMQMSANLRYTTEDDWLVFRGRGVRRHGFGQFNDLCKKVVSSDKFSGSEFSWGDGYIKRCADERDGPGNATIWRKVGTSHHLAYAVAQIANLAAP